VLRLRRRAPGARRLTPVELAEAAVLVDVSLVLCVLGWLLPYGGAFFVAAVVPVVALAARQRVRAVVVGIVAGASLAFIVGGTGLTISFLESAILGAFVGWGRRRAWGRARTVLVTVALVWPVGAAVTVGALLVFSDLRRLTFDQVRNSWSGLARILRNLGLQGVANAGDTVVSWSITYWYVVVPVVLLVALVAVTWLAQTLSHAVVPRVVVGRPHTRLGIADRDGSGAAGVPDDDHAGPLPARFVDVTFRYPGEPQPTLAGVSLLLDPGRFVAVTGPNGAGKSSLSRVLAGAALESGAIERPGAVALGRPGGTAMLFQRPESQVLGVRVRDDVVWGLHHDTAATVDVDALLAQVGLAGLADRETSTLSGGELQRLALASALARAPALLVSDESTAMVDTAGRRRLLDLLRGLTARDTTVVHVTHRYGEIDPTDGLLRVERGRVIAGAAPPPSPEPSVAEPATGPGAPVLEVRDTGYVYSPATPWEHRALQAVTTTVHEGETVLVLGANGSGKSTFAWLLAGLLHPTEGEVLLDGEPVTRHVGTVGLAFQHARLQLLRPTVRGELAVVAPDEGSLVRSLAMVGLDASIAARPIDALSGGQQRRVLLARLLATGSRVLVLDEPFAGLDDEARVALADVLARLRATRAVAIVVVSHDLDDAAPFADRVVGLRDGRLVLDEPATTFDRSVASRFVAENAR
jgi:energy-coupling factor transport system ATP-binding protein